MDTNEDKYYTIPKIDVHTLPFRESLQAMKDYEFFKKVIINPRALLSMMRHSLTTSNEIAGVLLGHFDESKHEYLLTDSFNYPIKGTGSSVEVSGDCLAKANDRRLDLQYLGRLEDDIGWYHSHPNLHCFYSNTDVRQHKITWRGKMGTAVGLVIDPINTMVSAHLHLGAYSIRDPEEAKKRPPPTSAEIKKYGTAANEYYQLDIHYFCSEIDKAVLNDFISKSYGTALQSSPLSANSKYLIDSMEKSKQNIKPGEDKDPLELKDQIFNNN